MAFNRLAFCVMFTGTVQSPECECVDDAVQSQKCNALKIFKEAKPLATRFILVRHGQSTDNAAGRIQGRTDVSVLTDAGRQMARKVAPALQGISVDYFYSSPLQRAAQTAQEIADLSPQLPPIQKHEQLTEIDLRLWERMLKSDIATKYPEAYHLWCTNPSALCMELPGENGPVQHYPVQSLYDRIEGFWQDILPQHQDQTVLIVAHNGVIRALISTALGIGADRYQVLRQSNCGLSVLNFAGGWGEQVQLESMNLTAHLGQPLPSRQEPDSVRLLLVRHGETDWNRQSRFQGQIDIPLNDNGKAQAEKVATFLKAIPMDEAVTSPLARPKQTAAAILQHHPEISLQADDRFKEIGHGVWEGKLESEIKAEYSDLLAAWKAHPETVQMPEGENLQQVWDRSVAAWQDIVAKAKPGTTYLVTAHDAVNKTILCHVMGLKPKDIWMVKQGNGSVTVVDYPQGLDALPVLQALNITTHLSEQGILDQTAAGAL